MKNQMLNLRLRGVLSLLVSQKRGPKEAQHKTLLTQGQQEKELSIRWNQCTLIVRQLLEVLGPETHGLTENDCTYSASVETCSVDKVADKESFDDLDNTPNINPLRCVEASPRALRRRTKTTSSEASPAPSISKRGRVRKVKSEVRDLLSAAKQELDPKNSSRTKGLARCEKRRR